MIHEDIHILSSHPLHSGQEVQALINQGLVIAGSVLIQNPFDKNLYHHESEAMRQIAQEKWLHFSTLCSYLGARKVEIKTINLKDKNGEREFFVEAGAPMLFDAESNTKKISRDSFFNMMSFNIEFSGGNPDIGAATEFMKITGLTHENIMRNLLNQSQIPNNKTEKLEVILELTNEARRNFEVYPNSI